MTDVVILGCGPAGLLAAHAVVGAGLEPLILSRAAEPSPVAPAVFLHRAIPHLNNVWPDELIKFIKVGDAEVYAEKVYGDPAATTSWRKFPAGLSPAWALSPAYDLLWSLYREFVRECDVGPRELAAIERSNELVISTIPAPAVCGAGCEFPSRPTWITSNAPSMIETNTMVYNGHGWQDWMRSSDLFGVRSTEYSYWVRGAKSGVKVLPTTCRCNPRVVRVGRWARWQPGVLLHHAYEDTVRALSLMGALR